MSQKQNEIIRYLNLIYRYRYLFVATSLLVTTAITLYSYSLPKKYQADSTVFIEESIINKLVEGIAMTEDINDQTRVLQVSLVTRDIVTKVLEDIESDIFTKSSSEQQAFISGLRKRIKISVSRGRDLFTVSLVDSNPKFAQDFVNTLVSRYVEESVSSKREESYGANRFLVEQLELFKRKLDQAESAIIEFRKKEGVYLAQEEGAEIAEIRRLLREIQDIELEQQSLQARRANMREQLNNLEPTVDVFSEVGGGNRVVDLERRLNDLLLTYTENYPEVVRLKAEIEGVKRLQASAGQEENSSSRMTSVNPVYQEVQQNILAVETEISSLEARKSNLAALVAEKEKRLKDVPAHQKELAVLIQERDSHREIYQELLGRMGQSEVTKQMEISDKAATFRVVDPADYPEIPVSPDMVKLILMAIAAGLGCGFGLAVLLDTLDNSVKEPQQVEDLGVDILALIPSISDAATDARVKRRDWLLYGVGTLCYSCFVGLLVAEFIQLI